MPTAQSSQQLQQAPGHQPTGAAQLTGGLPPYYSGDQHPANQQQQQNQQQQTRDAFAKSAMAEFAKYSPGAMQNLQTLMHVLSKDKAAKGGNAEPCSSQSAGLVATDALSQQSAMSTPCGKPTPPRDLVAQMLGQAPPPPPLQQQQQALGQPTPTRHAQPEWSSQAQEAVGRVRTARVQGEMANMPFPNFDLTPGGGEALQEEVVLSPRSAKMLVDVLHEGVQGVTKRQGVEGRVKAAGASNGVPPAVADTKRKSDTQLGGKVGHCGVSRTVAGGGAVDESYHTPTHARLRTGVAEYLRLHPFESTGLDIHDTLALKRVNSYMCAAASAHGRPFRNNSSQPVHGKTLQDKTNLPPVAVLGK